MNEIRQQAIPILLVEDDEDDICLTERAFKKGMIDNPFYVVRDGEEAIEFLTHTGRYTDPEDAPRPGLILLDLNMPRLDGREVLKIIKNDDNLRSIPVVILSTSSQQHDIDDTYRDGANSFISKPIDFTDFLTAVIGTGKYWLQVVELPEVSAVARP